MLLEMQDPCTGVKSQPQRLVITTIPHAITGKEEAVNGQKQTHVSCMIYSDADLVIAPANFHGRAQVRRAQTRDLQILSP